MEEVGQNFQTPEKLSKDTSNAPEKMTDVDATETGDNMTDVSTEEQKVSESTQSTEQTTENKTPTEPQPEEATEPEDEFTTVIAQMSKEHKETVFKQSISAILKMLEALKKRPQDRKNRRLRKDNISVKKFVLDINGGLAYMKAVGFAESTAMVGKKEMHYLQIEESQLSTQECKDKLDRAISVLSTKLKRVNEAIADPTVKRERVRCKGGCGFFGDEKTEDYCSVCHKKKLFGIKPTEPEEERVKCTQGCGFWGSRTLKGMCSMCFKKEFPEEKIYMRKFRSAMVKLRAMHRFKLGALKKDRKVQVNKKKCWMCKRKVGIVGIECRCGYIFCGTHRYAEAHNCTYDHKKNHRENLRRENQLIKTDKFEKLDE